MSKISDQTLIPIGIAVLVIGGGAAWLTALYAKTDALADSLRQKTAVIESVSHDVNQIKLDIREIKTRLRVKD